jgi:hypothetical protein
MRRSAYTYIGILVEQVIGIGSLVDIAVLLLLEEIVTFVLCQ